MIFNASNIVERKLEVFNNLINRPQAYEFHSSKYEMENVLTVAFFFRVVTRKPV